jgi:hypothetical protein
MGKQVKFYINPSKQKRSEKSPDHYASFKQADGTWLNFASGWNVQGGISVVLDLENFKKYAEANPDAVSQYTPQPKQQDAPQNVTNVTPNVDNTVINSDDWGF